MKRIKFYLDFDGTISQKDVVDRVLEHFAKPEWQAVEAEWQAGSIGSRECLTRQMQCVTATKEEIATLCTELKVDDGFVSFLRKAKEFSIPVIVVSDGFDFLIQQVLARNLLEHQDLLRGLPIYSNKLIWTTEGPRAAFFSDDVCRHGCANCKPEVIKDTANPDDTILFVGDGMSDRYAALLSNKVFAKGALLKFCLENDIDTIPYETFSDIESWLVKNYGSLKSLYDIKAEIV